MTKAPTGSRTTTTTGITTTIATTRLENRQERAERGTIRRDRYAPMILVEKRLRRSAATNPFSRSDVVRLS
jgi:hypothetical protein